MQLHLIVLCFISAFLAQAQAQAEDAEWPAPTDGCDINVARDLYFSQSARLRGPSTTVIMGFPTDGAAPPSDACDESEDPAKAKRQVLEVGKGAYIAPTSGPYGMGK
ncbi:uncharacterized protein I303_100653 [Kwoniella dejecticola CBS 10117]|uniref:Uncharacterized protein n=1 Tax=Kwoniella dejecticola CBS 10117 TaxID=1296121 RepID=A0A1A6AFJ3_9TREE|nr:uncharacterized protein I303_00657 [Kwoniella dejecticola CBS 10117]OBR88840.1 hypothetical protein I303_00657 [Kwoniella dejecticola CBS 10117]